MACPTRWFRSPVEVRATPTTVEIFHQGQRVASHLRGRERGQVLTERGFRVVAFLRFYS
jgi:hypothetical protein